MDLKEQPQLRHVKGLGVDLVDWTYKDLRMSNPQIGLHSSLAFRVSFCLTHLKILILRMLPCSKHFILTSSEDFALSERARER